MRNIIAANWKMHFSVDEAEKTAGRMASMIDTQSVDVVVCANFTHLDRLNAVFKGGVIKLGAQNMYFEEKGAFTGEVSPLMLKAVGCEYVILGHSERRHIFREDDKFINKKVESALNHKLVPIVCTGETLDEREGGRAFETIANQIKKSLENIRLNDVIIAYEPVWAIGTGAAANKNTITEMHNFIRSIAGSTPILYGGSVKRNNAQELADIKNVNGFLIGGASLFPDDFDSIINKFIKIKGV